MRMIVALLLSYACLHFILCQKADVILGSDVSETFYLENGGASMHCLVEGNTESKSFLVYVHGGPATPSLWFNTSDISENIEDRCAVVYWDQRDAGASQGNANGDKLNLKQMTDDLRKLILVLKNRYGQDINVFILGHSFGGLLTSSFMTTGDNQSLVNGWIYADGCHNYPLGDTLMRNMLLSVGQQQITLNKNVGSWQKIVDYCNEYKGNFTYDESMQLSSYAIDAETYIDGVAKTPSFFDMTIEHAVKDNMPITSAALNYLYTANAAFNQDLSVTEFTSKLHLVTKPTLVLFGEYDFMCPKELGTDLFNRISSTEKRMAISPISGHTMMYQDESFFCSEVNSFMEKYTK